VGTMRTDRTGVSGRFYTLVGVDTTIDKLDRLVEQFPRALVTLIRTCTEGAKAQAIATAPRGKTGQLRDNIFTKYFDDQTTGALFVGGRMADPRTQKTRARLFPVWIEFGTRYVDPKPFLLPAGRAGWARLMTEAPAMIERLVKEAE
jgi:hypothetical protein